MLAVELFAKALWIFGTSVLVNNNNLCGRLASPLELPLNLDEKFKVTLLLFLIRQIYLKSIILCHFILKQNKFIILLQFLVKNSKLFLSLL